MGSQMAPTTILHTFIINSADDQHPMIKNRNGKSSFHASHGKECSEDEQWQPTDSVLVGAGSAAYWEVCPSAE